MTNTPKSEPSIPWQWLGTTDVDEFQWGVKSKLSHVWCLRKNGGAPGTEKMTCTWIPKKEGPLHKGNLAKILVNTQFAWRFYVLFESFWQDNAQLIKLLAKLKPESKKCYAFTLASTAAISVWDWNKTKREYH